MIRKNPSGDLPLIAESAYVDKTAIICGKVVLSLIHISEPTRPY